MAGNLQAELEDSFDARNFFDPLGDPCIEFKEKITFELDKGNVLEAYDALRSIVETFCSHEPQSECFEIMINGIAEIARANITKHDLFSLHSFICIHCTEIITDPVTLPCGHTYSKKCIIKDAKYAPFICLDCQQKYKSDEITVLNNNVMILALVEKFYATQLLAYKNKVKLFRDEIWEKLHDVGTFMIINQDVSDLQKTHLSSRVLRSMTPLEYRRIADKKYKAGDVQEAFKSYMSSLTLAPESIYAKSRAIEVFRHIFENTVRLPYLKSSAISYKNNGLSKQAQNSGSSESINMDVDDESSSDDDDDDDDDLEEDAVRRLDVILNVFFDEMNEIAENNNYSKLDITNVEKEDFECPLCMRLLLKPVTTPCGHTFCKACLKRSLDHQVYCPLCKSELEKFSAVRDHNVTEFLEFAVEHCFPEEIAERKESVNKELEMFANAGKDSEYEIPIFVCTVALPSVPCFLHVFEPRYRLMIRLCMESGGRQFGMCCLINDRIPEYGTMLEIRNVKYLDDGRSIVDAIGRRRFRILSKRLKDGYNIAKVEYIEDIQMSYPELASIGGKYTSAYHMACMWLDSLPEDKQNQVKRHHGSMPRIEIDFSSPDGPSWMWWMLSVLPIDAAPRMFFLSITSFPLRLELFIKMLCHFYPQQI